LKKSAPPSDSLNAERQRLQAQYEGREDWHQWGPYLAERAWGTVREDYSPGGTAWEAFDHDQARSRAYRWNEDGMGGICDDQQRLCFAIALWNGRDPILKERAFGLTGNQGNHGEDVKEYYFYQDATPSHSYLRYLYKYPQGEYPYARLVEENRRRGRQQPSFNLLDSGLFEQQRYWDLQVEYAKAEPQLIHIRLTARNRGPEQARLHLIPQLWFRNSWSWDDDPSPRPRLEARREGEGNAWRVQARHPELGDYHLYGQRPCELLVTENESNSERLWGLPNPGPYVKDAFHRRIVTGERGVVNPSGEGASLAPGTSSRWPPGSRNRSTWCSAPAPWTIPSPVTTPCSPAAAPRPMSSTTSCCPRPTPRITASCASAWPA